MTEAGIILLVNIVTSFFKRWVYPKWGKLGVQAVVFVFALIGAVYYMYLKDLHGVAEFVGNATAMFCMAVALYEVILQRFSLFKGESLEERASE